MNERIKEIAERSGAGWDDKYHWYVGNEQMKKFAELIVGECVGIADEYDGVGSTIVSRIKKHFGVE